MRALAYLIGLFVSLFVGFTVSVFTGVYGAGVVAALVVFLISACMIRAREDRAYETDGPRGAHARDAVANAGAYQIGHSTGADYGGSDVGGGGCDGGGGDR